MDLCWGKIGFTLVVFDSFSPSLVSLSIHLWYICSNCRLLHWQQLCFIHYVFSRRVVVSCVNARTEQNLVLDMLQQREGKRQLHVRVYQSSVQRGRQGWVQVSHECSWTHAAGEDTHTHNPRQPQSLLFLLTVSRIMIVMTDTCLTASGQPG